jgi:hypothetical protein
LLYSGTVLVAISPVDRHPSSAHAPDALGPGRPSGCESLSQDCYWRSRSTRLRMSLTDTIQRRPQPPTALRVATAFRSTGSPTRLATSAPVSSRMRLYLVAELQPWLPRP